MAAVVGLSGCGSASPSDAAEEVSRSEQAIVGGEDGYLDSAVAIRTTQCPNYEDAGYGVPIHCTGLLISPTVVLTAAHCVSNAQQGSHPPVSPIASTFSVAIGCHNITTPDACTNWVPLAPDPDGIQPYALYPGSVTYDVALLRLATPTTVKPTRLLAPARKVEINDGDMVSMYGWGWTEDVAPSPVLQFAEAPISSWNSCLPSGLCRFGTGSPPYYLPSAWEGDSGGPVLVERDGEWFTAGVYHGGGGLNQTPSLHMFVPWFFSWIASHTPDLPAQSYLPSAQFIPLW
jgi:hypothetical protein